MKNNFFRFIILTSTILTIFGCKIRQSQSIVREAGAGHIDNTAWFERFGATFPAEQVSSAIVRIMDISYIGSENLISDFKGWPKNSLPALADRANHPYFSSVATGFFISPDGYGLTNHHVLKECIGHGIFTMKKCDNIKAIVGTAFNANEFAFSNLETKINNKIVDIANEHIDSLRKDRRNLNIGLKNEVKVRETATILDQVEQNQIFDLCIVASNGRNFDAVVIKFVPEEQSCDKPITVSNYFKLPTATEINEVKSGVRLFSAGFGSYQRFYSDHADNSRADFFNSMKVNFATGIIDKTLGHELRTSTTKKIYPEDENFEAMDTNKGHSGSPVFLNSSKRIMPPLAGVHYAGSNKIRVHQQTSVFIDAIIKTYFRGQQCLEEYRAARTSIKKCLK